MDRHHAHYPQDQLDRGRLLLWVSVRGAEQEAKAREVLEKSGAEHVHAHDVPEEKLPLEGGVSYVMSFMTRLGLCARPPAPGERYQAEQADGHEREGIVNLT